MDVSSNTYTTSDVPQITDAGCMNNERSQPPCPRKASIEVTQEGQAPDYKHQCHTFIRTRNSSPIDEHTENQVPTVRCSNSSSITSSPINRSYIPFVCGVPLSEDEHVIDTFDPHMVHNATTTSINLNTYTRDSEAPAARTSPEQAPIPQIISVKRETFENKQSTLSNSEKRYWIKVVVIAIVVNTLIVLGGVIGGVCGISGCDFSRDEKLNLGDDMYRGNSTDSPTPAPSRRLVASEPPVLSSVNAPTAPYIDFGDESLSYPSFSPVLTFQPSVGSAANGGAGMPTATARIKLVVILPIAIIVDAMLIVGYLCFHYSRWTLSLIHI